MSAPTEAQRAAAAALKQYLDEDEIVVGWAVTIEVVGPDDIRYLAHRHSEGLSLWTALGMLRSAVIAAEDDIRDQTEDAED